MQKICKKNQKGLTGGRVSTTVRSSRSTPHPGEIEKVFYALFSAIGNSESTYYVASGCQHG
jgi:hypothetical protein